jgi:glucose/arabinose dehydrogenase
MAVDAPQYPGGGWLGFDSSGNLWIATADAGGIGDPSGSAQSDSSRLGKIIRAGPNPDPFAGASPVFYLVSTVAKGLHQPNGGSFFGGGLVLPDRGQAATEEIDLLPAGANGANFGWPFKEGTRIVQGTPPAGVVDPVLEYARSTGAAAQGIVGGAIGGNAVPSLNGQYVFADRLGAIFSVPAASLQSGRTLTASAIERRTLDFAPDAGAIDEPVAVVADAAGRLYVLDADGEIFRVDAG